MSQIPDIKKIIEGDVNLSKEQVEQDLKIIISEWRRDPAKLQVWRQSTRLYEREKEKVIALQAQITDKNDKIKDLEQANLKYVAKIKKLTTPEVILEREIKKNLFEAIYPSEYRIEFLITVFQGFIRMALNAEHSQIINKYAPHINRALQSLKERKQNIELYGKPTNRII